MHRLNTCRGEGSASVEPHGGSGQSERSERRPVPTIDKVVW